MSLETYEIIQVGIIFLLGVGFHFIYTLSGKKKILAIFGSVNESTWEHCKLLIWPALVTYAVAYSMYGESVPNYVFAKVIGIYVMVISLIVIYYSYKVFVKRLFVPGDILIFFISIVIGQYVSFYVMNSNIPTSFPKDEIIIVLSVLLGLAVLLFTFFPPKIFLFKCPVDQKYGL